MIQEARKSDRLTPAEKNVARYYLFACFTGLRLTDVKNLKASQIDQDMIKVLQGKTEAPVYIPMSSHARKLLPRNFEEQDRVFQVISNQKTNEKLKSIAKKCGIRKNLTFHTARHTFATIALSLGIDIMVIKEVLGHSNIATTMIYTKVVTEHRNREMQKWERMSH